MMLLLLSSGLLIVLFCSTSANSSWQQGSTPKVVIDYNSTLKTALRFRNSNDNANTTNEYFRILSRESDWMLVGGQNVLYNVSLRTMQENHRLEWRPKDKTREWCQMKGRQSSECHNFIRVVMKKTNPDAPPGSNSNYYTICGTNAFEPMCRKYAVNSDGQLTQFVGEGDEDNSDMSGVGRIAFDAQYNSTHIFVDDKLFSGIALDSGSMKPAIVRDGMLRTPTYPPLNDPHFVGGFADSAFVYFGIRETAAEHINCGKRVFPRIARVCRDDPGFKPYGKKVPYWTSFSKARLNCSVPGDYPFYFDELHGLAASGPVIGQKQRRILYGVFTTPENSISGAAICAFDMADVENIFAHGRFKEQKYFESNWLPINENNVVDGARAALQCTYNNTSVSENVVRFIESHPLMDKAVPALHGRPLLIDTATNDGKSPLRFRSIDVLPQVEAVDGSRYDVLYIGTNDGRLIKVINTLVDDDSSASTSAVIVEEHQLLPRAAAPITSVQVVGGERVVVVTDDELLSLPLQHCSEAASCGECVARQDPHCAWHAKLNKCVQHETITRKDERVWLLQNVRTGKHNNCTAIDTKPTLATTKPTTTSAPKITMINSDSKLQSLTDKQLDADDAANMMSNASDGDDEPLRESRRLESAAVDVGAVPDIKASRVLPVSGNTYREETLAMAVIVTLILSLIVGFVLGYQLNRWRMASEAKDSNLSVGSNLSDYAQFPSHLDSTRTASSANNNNNNSAALANHMLINGGGITPLAAACNGGLLQHSQYQQQQLYNPYAIEPSNNPAKQQIMLNVNPTATILRHTSSLGLGANNHSHLKMLNNGTTLVTAGLEGVLPSTATLPRYGNTLNRNLAALKSSTAYT